METVSLVGLRRKIIQTSMRNTGISINLGKDSRLFKKHMLLILLITSVNNPVNRLVTATTERKERKEIYRKERM